MECSRLWTEGLCVKDLPKKPKCLLKPELPVEEQGDDDERSSSSLDEGRE